MQEADVECLHPQPISLAVSVATNTSHVGRADESNFPDPVTNNALAFAKETIALTFATKSPVSAPAPSNAEQHTPTAAAQADFFPQILPAGLFSADSNASCDALLAAPKSGCDAIGSVMSSLREQWDVGWSMMIVIAGFKLAAACPSAYWDGLLASRLFCR